MEGTGPGDRDGGTAWASFLCLGGPCSLPQAPFPQTMKAFRAPIFGEEKRPLHCPRLQQLSRLCPRGQPVSLIAQKTVKVGMPTRPPTEAVPSALPAPCPLSPPPAQDNAFIFCLCFIALLSVLRKRVRCSGCWAIGDTAEGDRLAPRCPALLRAPSPWAPRAAEKEGRLGGGELLRPRGRIYRPREQRAQSPGTFPSCQVSKHRAGWHLVRDKVR